MKAEDFERLKAICEKEGFEVVNESPKENDKYYVVKKRDEWDGVDFVECIKSGAWNFIKGKIYKKVNGAALYQPNSIISETGEPGSCLGLGDYMDFFKPSNQQAYIEQLKKEAFERFGELLNELDFFKSKIDRSNLSGINISEYPGFKYYPNDSLYFNGLLIYQQGKWAKRVQERVRVLNPEIIQAILYNDPNLVFRFYCEVPDKKHLPKGVKDFLSSQLEKYLNGEIE